MASPLILIPARMAATRFPNKPLALIAGLPMVVHVVRRAEKAGLGEPVVAAGDESIVAAVKKFGHRAVLTDANLPSGTDRIYAALQMLDPKSVHDVIVNVQGDEPLIEPETIRRVYDALIQTGADMATAVVRFKNPEDEADPNKVKAVISWKDAEKKQGYALYFTRGIAPHGEGERYHHIGIYAYTRKALADLVKLKQSELEKREKLEQLRALEAGMKIAVARVEKASRGVDTQADLKAIEAELAATE